MVEICHTFYTMSSLSRFQNLVRLFVSSFLIFFICAYVAHSNLQHILKVLFFCNCSESSSSFFSWLCPESLPHRSSLSLLLVLLTVHSNYIPPFIWVSELRLQLIICRDDYSVVFPSKQQLIPRVIQFIIWSCKSLEMLRSMCCKQLPANSPTKQRHIW